MSKWFVVSIVSHITVGLCLAMLTSLPEAPLARSSPAAMANPDSSMVLDSSINAGLSRIQETVSALIREHNRRLDALSTRNEQLSRELPSLLDSAIPAAMQRMRALNDAQHTFNENSARVRAFWIHADSALRAGDIALAKQSSESSIEGLPDLEQAVTNLMQEFDNSQSAVNELNKLLSSIPNDSVQKMLAAGKERQKQNETRLNSLPSRMSEISERLKKTGLSIARLSPRPSVFERWALQRNMKTTNRELDLLDSLRQGENEQPLSESDLRSIAESAGKNFPLSASAKTALAPERFSYAHNPTAAGRYLSEINRLIDSLYRESLAASRALSENISYEKAIRQMPKLRKADTIASDTFGDTHNEKHPVEVRQEDLQRMLDLVKKGTERPAWASDSNTHKYSDSVKITGGPQGDTVEIKLAMNADSLQKLAQLMRARHDTLYFESSDPATRDTTRPRPFKLSPEQWEMLRKAFASADSEDAKKNAVHATLFPPILKQIDISRIDSLQKLNRPMFFKLFPNVTVKYKGYSHCVSPPLFCVPSPAGGGGQGSALFPGSFSDLNHGIRSLDNKLSWMKRSIGMTTWGLNTDDPFRGMKAMQPSDRLPPKVAQQIADVSTGRQGANGQGASGSDLGSSGLLSLAQFSGQEGSRLASSGKPATWFYISSWYVVGPFPNPNRSNIARAFPPESGIDLDAVYQGEKGKVLRWEYLSSADYRIVPYKMREYGIYYAFSRVWSEKPTTVWIALGSDDRSDLWINGQMVWRSSDMLKVWSMDEGFRKIALKAGENQILMRLENGWGTTCFSLLISPALKSS